MIFSYPRFEDLNIAPSFLTFGAVAIRALADAGWIMPTVHELTEAERAEYQAQHSETRQGWLKTKFGGKRIA